MIFLHVKNVLALREQLQESNPPRFHIAKCVLFGKTCGVKEAPIAFCKFLHATFEKRRIHFV